MVARSVEGAELTENDHISLFQCGVMSTLVAALNSYQV